MLASHLVHRFGDFIYGIRMVLCLLLFLSLLVLTFKHIIHDMPETTVSFQERFSQRTKKNNSQHMRTLFEFSSVRAMTLFIMLYSAPS